MFGTSFPMPPSALPPSTKGGRSCRRASSIDFTGASLRTISMLASLAKARRGAEPGQFARIELDIGVAAEEPESGMLRANMPMAVPSLGATL